MEQDVKISMEKIMTAYTKVGASKYAQEVRSPLVLSVPLIISHVYACPVSPLTSPLVYFCPSLHPLSFTTNRKFGPKC